MKQHNTEFPWLTFLIQDQCYAVNSECVNGILGMPEHLQEIPDSTGELRGIFTMRDQIIPLLDMRSLFGLRSLEQDYIEFTDMLDRRKQDHLDWVEELKRCVEDGSEFTLATDPHQCAFGRWYDQFSTDIHSVAHHMNKIEEPHRKLHEAALAVQHCTRNCESCARAECLKSILDRLQQEYVPMVLSLLDEAKEIFRSSFREMVIVLELRGQSLAIIVDEVLSVRMLEPISSGEGKNPLKKTAFLSDLAENPDGSTILMLNEEELFVALGSELMGAQAGF